MTDSAPPPLQDSVDVRQLANAIRLLAFVVVIGLSIVNMGVIRSIGRFEAIFHDMLGGARLPLLTEMILNGRVVWREYNHLTGGTGVYLRDKIWARISDTGALAGLGIKDS